MNFKQLPTSFKGGVIALCIAILLSLFIEVHRYVKETLGTFNIFYLIFDGKFFNSSIVFVLSSIMSFFLIGTTIGFMLQKTKDNYWIKGFFIGIILSSLFILKEGYSLDLFLLFFISSIPVLGCIGYVVKMKWSPWIKGLVVGLIAYIVPLLYILVDTLLFCRPEGECGYALVLLSLFWSPIILVCFLIGIFYNLIKDNEPE